MNLRDRLRLLKAAGTTGRASAPPQAAAGPGAPPPAAGTAVAGGCLDGYTVSSSYGETFYSETRYPIEYCRGPLPLEHLFHLPGTAWEVLGFIPGAVDMRRAVFFDTETTGLAGGTGTYAFLVGLGFFEGHDFVVRQYFLRDYHEEEALLEALSADLSRFELMVSFNGKSFDWPLMETRFRMSRRRPPLSGVPHLDLLHPSRRVWKERLQQCNLTNLEARVLGVQRYGDVPGHLIPQLYFEYLRTGDALPLHDVILHNRLDILSLVSLAGWLGQIVTDPLGATPDGELVCGDDLFALGRLFEARGLAGRAVPCFEAACQRGLEAVTEAAVLRELGQSYKRQKELGRAVSIWESMTAGPGGLSLHPFVELAKYYEHVERDYTLAHTIALRALEIAQRRRSIAGAHGPATLKELQEVQHRLGRLERKLNQAR